MAVVYKYRVWCNTEAVWKFVWGEVPPTKCPDNGADTIDPNSISIIETVGDAQLYMDGAAITTKKEKGELTGNIVLLKQVSVVLAAATNISKTWSIPDGKQWNIRVFAASNTATEVIVDLECWMATTITTIPPGPPTLVRINPFNADADEPIVSLSLQANAARDVFYESLPFVGEDQKELRVVIRNNSSNKSSEVSVFLNGYESTM